MPSSDTYIDVLKCMSITKKELISGEIYFISRFQNDLKTTKIDMKTEEKTYQVGDMKEIELKDYLEEDETETNEEKEERKEDMKEVRELEKLNGDDKKT